MSSSGPKPTATGRACLSAIGSLPFGTQPLPLTPSGESVWMIDQDLKDLLLALNAHGVEYLVVGGYAVGVHSEPRATKDLDIFIRADEKNSVAIYHALAAFGAPLKNLTPEAFRNEPASVFQIGLPPNRIDILQSIDGVTFDEAWKSKVEGLVDGEVPAHVISRDHLIRNKLSTGRAQDLADVEAMRNAAGSQPTED
jgi:hypothetical protein